MKYYVTVVLILLAATFAFCQEAAVVEVPKVVEESDLGVLLAKKQVENLDEVRAEIAKMEYGIKVLQDELALEESESMERRIQERSIELQRYQEDKAREIEEARKVKLAEIYKLMREATEKVAEEQGYSLVLQRTGVLYAGDAADITDAVIKKMNSMD